MVPVLSRSREFSLFLDGTGTGTGKNWSRKKVPVPVPEKILGTVTLCLPPLWSSPKSNNAKEVKEHFFYKRVFSCSAAPSRKEEIKPFLLKKTCRFSGHGGTKGQFVDWDEEKLEQTWSRFFFCLVKNAPNPLHPLVFLFVPLLPLVYILSRAAAMMNTAVLADVLFSDAPRSS